MTNNNLKYYFTAFILLFFLPLGLQAATITATTDRNPVQLNESFTLMFEANGSVDDDPDFTPLKKDFDILNQSQSSNTSIINGSISRSVRWNLNLMAKRQGVLTIPSISFGNDVSPQLRLTVSAADTNAATPASDFFAEMEINEGKHYVQGQIILTQRLYSAYNLSGYEFSKLELEGVDTVIEQLGDDKNYQKQKGNRAYLVIERHYALFPQQSGKLSIQPLLAQANLRNSANSYFDPFRSRQQVKRARSKNIELDILPVAQGYTSSHWLPAKEIQLVEEWPEQKLEFVVGQPVTRTLTLLADGLTSAQLPEISPPDLNDFKQYPDQPLLNDKKATSGIIGMRQEKIAMIPTRPGRYQLPAITIQWWNTQTGKIENASIAARTITVAAATGLPSAPQAPVLQATEIPGTTVDSPARETAVSGTSSLWIISTGVFAIAWVITLLAWFISSRGKANNATRNKHASHTATIKQSLSALKSACKSGQPQACKQALLDWGKAMFSDQPPHSLGALAQRCGEPLASSINQLNRTLYSPEPQDWSSAGLLNALEKYSANNGQKDGLNDYSLEPLYK